jgi:hypothetical protein
LVASYVLDSAASSYLELVEFMKRFYDLTKQGGKVIIGDGSYCVYPDDPIVGFTYTILNGASEV